MVLHVHWWSSWRCAWSSLLKVKWQLVLMRHLGVCWLTRRHGRWSEALLLKELGICHVHSRVGWLLIGRLAENWQSIVSWLDAVVSSPLPLLFWWWLLRRNTVHDGLGLLAPVPLGRLTWSSLDEKSRSRLALERARWCGARARSRSDAWLTASIGNESSRRRTRTEVHATRIQLRGSSAGASRSSIGWASWWLAVIVWSTCVSAISLLHSWTHLLLWTIVWSPLAAHVASVLSELLTVVVIHPVWLVWNTARGVTWCVVWSGGCWSSGALGSLWVGWCSWRSWAGRMARRLARTHLGGLFLVNLLGLASGGLLDSALLSWILGDNGDKIRWNNRLKLEGHRKCLQFLQL